MRRIVEFLRFQDLNQIEKLPRNSQFHYSYLLGMAMGYMMLMILSGLLIYKTVKIGFFTGPVSILLQPIIYCFSNVVAEVYGYAVARNMMWWFILFSGVFTLLSGVLIHFPSPDSFADQAAFNLVFGRMSRVFLAGILGTLIGLSFDNYVVSKFKVWMDGKRYWFRGLISTCGGEILYNIIAYPIMYFGVVNSSEFLNIFISVTVFKIIMTLVFLGPECLLARYLKLKEKINVFDYNANYSIFKIRFSDESLRSRLKIVN